MSFTLSSFIRGTFHRYEREEGEERIMCHYWLTRRSRRNPIFFITTRSWMGKNELEKKKMKIVPLFFFFFLFLTNGRIHSIELLARRNIFPIREEILFIDEILEAFVDKRRDSFLFKGNHNGSTDKSSRN